uniref:Monothiol glutaredoxin5 putative n=1 Tax=Albugo laibachii Nc14 TaxID=890382 RepID=F0WJQ1_9STRA|nr:monothiol glutaredoxin5 putative [Albugo laibachii Nc14]|eukprot:CCA21502.1 monothiol glutaredoxin5 putative [Albugo laibachii Nc14]
MLAKNSIHWTLRLCARQRSLAAAQLQLSAYQKNRHPSTIHPTLRFFASKAANDKESHSDFQPKIHSTASDDVHEMIQKHVSSYPILLYMKGTPSAPQCGFSMQVVRILHSHGVSFDSINVLDHPEIRNGIKEFSKWPTIPQLYVDGEFVGGCDIVSDLHQSGELADILKKHKD